jgi:NAD(P)-dependent dehydrogenase (short-subunit alcohol dehydrogenase family)
MPVSTDQKVWLITGASSGFGKALAEKAIAIGDYVAVVSRREERLAQLVNLAPERVLALPADLTENSAVHSVIDKTLTRFGRIDVLANVAGKGVVGACEEFNQTELRDLMELNFFACVNITRAVLPHFRKQGAGHIVTFSSIAGLVGVNALGPYCASKYALEGWMDTLALETKNFGIACTLIEPGAFRTEFCGDSNMRPSQPIEDYRPITKAFADYMVAADGNQIGDPKRAADCVLQVVNSEHSPLRLMLGEDAYTLWDNVHQKRNLELNTWRDIGMGTSFPDATAMEIKF